MPGIRHSVFAAAALSLILVSAGATPLAEEAAKKSTVKKPTSKVNKSSTSKKSAASNKQSPSKTTPQGKRSPSGSRRGRSAARKKAAPRGQQRPTAERYREIEEALAARGYLLEEPSGKWGPNAVEALRNFQADHDLSPTGRLDALCLTQLGLGPKQN